MKLITKPIAKKLAAASLESTEPICKLFAPWGWGPEWLLTCEKKGFLYGYAFLTGYSHLGMQEGEWGCLGTVEALEVLRGPFGFKVERDLHWTPSKKASL